MCSRLAFANTFLFHWETLTYINQFKKYNCIGLRSSKKNWQISSPLLEVIECFVSIPFFEHNRTIADISSPLLEVIECFVSIPFFEHNRTIADISSPLYIITCHNEVIECFVSIPFFEHNRTIADISSPLLEVIECFVNIPFFEHNRTIADRLRMLSWNCNTTGVISRLTGANYPTVKI